MQQSLWNVAVLFDRRMAVPSAFRLDRVTEIEHLSPAKESSIRIAQTVLNTEADALYLLSQTLPEDFATVVDLILNTEGRVIVSGIGKSGHVGRKIAATLASTGTPAFFVHASEASHGDLGMVTPDDILLLISNSGEAKELSDLLAYALRFSIPLIAISSKEQSTLGKAANYKLILPAAPEACPMGMAPTTSTTLTLALGDALAVALIERREFNSEKFKIFHPGGKLGAELATVKQLMHGREDLPLVEGDTPMETVLLEMTSKGFGTAGVVDSDGVLCGVISDGDLRRNMSRLMELNAADVASKSPITVFPDTMAVQALATMNGQKGRNISVLFAVDEAGRPEGILHIHDLLRAGIV